MAYQKFKYSLSPEQWKQEKEKRLQNIVTMFKNCTTADLVANIELAYVTKMGIPSDSWSLMNKLIMIGNNTEDARTWKAWEQAGSKVKRGEKAFFIWKPISKTVKVFPKWDKEHKTKGTIKYIDMNDPITADMEFLFPNFGTQAEFRKEQTENPDSIKAINEPKTLPPLMDIAKKLDLKVSWAKYDHRENGYYCGGLKKIVLKVLNEGTFFHELAHAIHEHISGTLKAGQDVDQEVIAQVVSCVVGSMYGIDNTRYTKKYVMAYSNGTAEESVKNINRNINTIKKILDFIFECETKKETK